jgi:Zn-dependent peptidase ImmA (M78 family)
VTFDYPSVFERARSLFATAAEHANVSLNAEHLDNLAHAIAVTQRALPGFTTKLPNLPRLRHRTRGTEGACNLAISFRQILEMGSVEPLLNLPEILCERFNILIFPTAPAPLAHACVTIDRYEVIFLSEQLEPSEQLFACAHSLAHLLEFVRSGDSDRSIFHRTVNAGLTKPPAEHLADGFALDLLVPEEGLKHAASIVRRLLNATGRSIGDVELLHLARIFGVPFIAIAKSCERTGMLPRGSAVAFDRFLTVKYGGAERRAQILELPVRPAVRIPLIPTPLKSIIRSNTETECASTEQSLAGLVALIKQADSPAKIGPANRPK